jgi:putative transposase
VKPYELINKKGAVAEGDEQKYAAILSQILVHAVFSTKNRADLIVPEIEDGLFGYMHGIVENNKSKLILANGTANHVHLLISLGKTIDISELIGDIKRDSSVLDQGTRRFSQLPLAGRLRSLFDRTITGVPRVVDYIRNQKYHHAKQDFKGEFRGLLKKYLLDYDEKYVWD